MKAVLKFMVARLSEATTYRGIALTLTALGVYVRPEIAAAITSIGLGVAGLIGVLVPDATTPAE